MIVRGGKWNLKIFKSHKISTEEISEEGLSTKVARFLVCQKVISPKKTNTL